MAVHPRSLSHISARKIQRALVRADEAMVEATAPVLFGEVDGLLGALAAKVDDSQISDFALTLLDDEDAEEARETLGVALGSDAPSLTIDVPTDYATLQLAIDYLLTKDIPAGALVTINCETGVHVYSESQFLSHPQAGQILITGQALTALAPTAAVTCVSTGAGVHDVTFNFSSAHGLAVGSVLRIGETNVPATDGTAGFRQLFGTWPVTAVPTATSCVVRNSSKNATLAAIVSLTDLIIRKYNTVFKFNTLSAATARMIAANIGITDNAAGLEIFSSGFTIRRIAILWDQTDAAEKKMGIGLRGGASLRIADDMGIHGFNTLGSNGIWAQSAMLVNANEIHISDCNEQGFAGHFGSTAILSDCRITGCGVGAKARSPGTKLVLSSASVFAGCTMGLDSEDGGLIEAGGCRSEYNSIYNAKFDSDSYGDLDEVYMTNAGVAGVLVRGSGIRVKGATIGGTDFGINASYGADINTDGGFPTLTGTTPIGITGTVTIDGFPHTETQSLATDGNIVFTPRVTPGITFLTGTLTANRTVTLLDDDATEGLRYRIIRPGGGAFTWDVGGLIFLGVGDWCEVVYNGAAFVLMASGQPLDAELAALGGLTSAADKLPYFTGVGSAALVDFPVAGRNLVAAVSAAAQRAVMGLGTAATSAAADFATAVHAHVVGDTTGLQAALDAKLDDSQATAFGLSLLDDANAAAGLATLGAAAAVHAHIIGDTTGLQAALDAKVALAGGTMTGALVSAAGTEALPAIGVGDTDTGFYWPGANNIGMSIGGVVRATFDNDSATFERVGGGFDFDVNGEGGTTLSIKRWGGGPGLVLRDVGGTKASQTAVVTNSNLGEITWTGWGGTNHRQGAKLHATTYAATPSDTDMQGRIIFSVSGAGSVSASEILRLDSVGGVQYGGANTVITINRHFRLRQYAAASLPTVASGDMIASSDVVAAALVSDGTEWLSPGVKRLYVVIANTTISIPMGWAIDRIAFKNTTANAVTGGIKIGTTSGATDVVVAQAVAASALDTIADASVLKKVFSTTAAQTLFIQAVTAWNSASLELAFFLRKGF